MLNQSTMKQLNTCTDVNRNKSLTEIEDESRTHIIHAPYMQEDQYYSLKQKRTNHERQPSRFGKRNNRKK